VAVSPTRRAVTQTQWLDFCFSARKLRSCPRRFLLRRTTRQRHRLLNSCSPPATRRIRLRCAKIGAQKDRIGIPRRAALVKQRTSPHELEPRVLPENVPHIFEARHRRKDFRDGTRLKYAPSRRTRCNPFLRRRKRLRSGMNLRHPSETDQKRARDGKRFPLSEKARPRAV